jgi:hypothetical protein
MLADMGLSRPRSAACGTASPPADRPGQERRSALGCLDLEPARPLPPSPCSAGGLADPCSMPCWIIPPTFGAIIRLGSYILRLRPDLLADLGFELLDLGFQGFDVGGESALPFAGGELALRLPPGACGSSSVGGIGMKLDPNLPKAPPICPYMFAWFWPFAS